MRVHIINYKDYICMFFRIVMSIAASFFIWICGALLNMDEPKINLMLILSFHPFFYWFCMWPGIVFLTNCNNHFALVIGRCIAFIYFAILITAGYREFFEAILSFPHQLFKIISLTGGLGVLLFFCWGASYMAIQYFIWIPQHSVRRVLLRRAIERVGGDAHL